MRSLLSIAFILIITFATGLAQTSLFDNADVCSSSSEQAYLYLKKNITAQILVILENLQSEEKDDDATAEMSTLLEEIADGLLRQSGEMHTYNHGNVGSSRTRGAYYSSVKNELWFDGFHPRDWVKFPSKKLNKCVRNTGDLGDSFNKAFEANLDFIAELMKRIFLGGVRAIHQYLPFSRLPSAILQACHIHVDNTTSSIANSTSFTIELPYPTYVRALTIKTNTPTKATNKDTAHFIVFGKKCLGNGIKNCELFELGSLTVDPMVEVEDNSHVFHFVLEVEEDDEHGDIMWSHVSTSAFFKKPWPSSGESTSEMSHNIAQEIYIQDLWLWGISDVEVHGEPVRSVPTY